MTDLFGDSNDMIEKSAVISDCGRYRYSLTRKWGEGPLLPFIMLNPSVADAEQDDPTIRRCIGFARREGAGGIIVGNLYGLRATNPAELNGLQDPFGTENGTWLLRIIRQAIHPIICAWGAYADLAQASGFMGLAKSEGARLVCLGKTKDGSPRHPLYVRADKVLEPFP